MPQSASRPEERATSTCDSDVWSVIADLSHSENVNTEKSREIIYINDFVWALNWVTVASVNLWRSFFLSDKTTIHLSYLLASCVKFGKHDEYCPSRSIQCVWNCLNMQQVEVSPCLKSSVMQMDALLKQTQNVHFKCIKNMYLCNNVFAEGSHHSLIF